MKSGVSSIFLRRFCCCRCLFVCLFVFFTFLLPFASTFCLLWIQRRIFFFFFNFYSVHLNCIIIGMGRNQNGKCSCIPTFLIEVKVSASKGGATVENGLTSCQPHSMMFGQGLKTVLWYQQLFLLLLLLFPSFFSRFLGVSLLHGLKKKSYQNIFIKGAKKINKWKKNI